MQSCPLSLSLLEIQRETPHGNEGKGCNLEVDDVEKKLDVLFSREDVLFETQKLVR